LTASVPGGFRDPNYTFEAFLKDLRAIEFTARFRAENIYSNPGKAILGEVVKRVTGQSWGENIHKRIFDPLGMDDSYTSNQDFERKVGSLDSVENIMVPAIKKEGVVSQGEWASIGTGDLYAPAGGIISTMEDLVKWITFRLNNGAHKGAQLISQESIKEIRKIRIPTSFANMGLSTSIIYPGEGLMGTGFGQYTFMHHGDKVIVHNGGWMNSVIEIVPQKNLGVGVFSNANFSDIHSFEAMAFVNAVALILIDYFLEYETVDWSREMLELIKKGN
jgi:CubicO group peptidase (beta-lactamase class C family)